MARVCRFTRTVTSQRISAACDGLVYKQSLTAGWRVIFERTRQILAHGLISEQNIRTTCGDTLRTCQIQTLKIKTEEYVQNRSHPFCDTTVDYRHTFRTLNVIVSEGFRYTHKKLFFISMPLYMHPSFLFLVSR